MKTKSVKNKFHEAICAEGMSKIMKFLVFAIVLAVLSGCATDSPAPIIGSPAGQNRTRSIAAEYEEYEAYESDPEPIPFAVLHKRNNTRLAMYEPADGVYLGAWLRPDTTFRAFENKVGKRHAVYVHEMYLDDDIPVNWLLQCIATLATPLFIVHPPQHVDEISDEDLEAEDLLMPSVPSFFPFFGEIETPQPLTIEEQVVILARRFGAFNLPMFVAFYPPGHGLAADEYLTLFRYARAVFMDYAPLTAFVWVAPDTRITPSSTFFPGNDSVDWVALPLFSGRNAYGFEKDILEDFRPFYMAFGEHKPIMLLPLGISHFSRADYVYNLHPAADEIRRVYHALGTAFPRVGMIVYGDAFIMTPGTNDDFSITLEQDLIETYRQIIDENHFITSIDKDASNGFRQASTWVRSRFHGYYFENRVYIDTRTMENELGISAPRQTTEINGWHFVESQRIPGHTVIICETRGIIFVE